LSALQNIVFLIAGAWILGLRLPRVALWGGGLLGTLAFAWVVRGTDWTTGDAEEFWRSGLSAREGRNPYVGSGLLNGGDIYVLNPPPAIAGFVLFSLLPMPIYLVVWRLLAVLTYGATTFASSFSLGDEGDARPWRLPVEALVLLSGAVLMSTVIRGAVASMASTYLTIAFVLGALVCRARGKPVAAGICLALGMTKVTTLLPMLLLFCRKKDLKTWIAFAVVGVVLTFVAIRPANLPAALERNLYNIRQCSAPGGINDWLADPVSNLGLITFDYAVFHLGIRERGVIKAVGWALTGGLGAWIAWLLLRRRRLPDAPACAILAAFSALFMYHRLYDMGILAIPLVYCAGRSLREPGGLRWAYRFCAAAILWVFYLRVNQIEKLLPVIQEAGLLPRLAEALVLPQAVWVTLAALVVLLVTEQHLAVVPAPAPASRPEGPSGDPGGAPGYSVSIIVPTYKEVESLPLLLARIEELRTRLRLDCEVLIMDDDSRDGTTELIASKALPWVRLVVRTSNRGLSPAVVDGLKLATKEYLVVMDADLSHPPERIPDMIRALQDGSEFVVGSRYVPGASTDENWGVLHWINSQVATLLARPFTRLADPMSGFFAMRRTLLDRAVYLTPIGYKIGLELLVKCGVTKASEVPIHFAQRQKGESKLSFKEQLRYIQHLRRLLLYRYPAWSSALQFAAVGASGVLVNLLALTLFIALKVPMKGAVALAIGVSILTNFGLNRRFTFSDARAGGLVRQLTVFVAACSLGAAINYALTMFMATRWPGMLPQVDALVGIVGGMAVNFVIWRLWVFKAPPPAELSIPTPLSPGGPKN
jgi:dolichol-phosphate mannosyltransferase